MTNKAARAGSTGIERRSYPVALEVRKAGSGVRVEGYASVTESPYEMHDMFGSYSEVISAGAFGKTLAENPKVQLLLNHSGMSLASTTPGTLRLSEDATGLLISADLNPARHDASDLIHALEDRAIDEMSFAFRVTRQTWSPDYDERRIVEVNIDRGDVSVVNLGANPATSVGAVRSAELTAYLDHLEGEELRAAIARLSVRLPAPKHSAEYMRALLA